jgi:hypothetical protein
MFDKKIKTIWCMFHDTSILPSQQCSEVWSMYKFSNLFNTCMLFRKLQEIWQNGYNLKVCNLSGPVSFQIKENLLLIVFFFFFTFFTLHLLIYFLQIFPTIYEYYNELLFSQTEPDRWCNGLCARFNCVFEPNRTRSVLVVLDLPDFY